MVDAAIPVAVRAWELLVVEDKGLEIVSGHVVERRVVIHVAAHASKFLCRGIGAVGNGGHDPFGWIWACDLANDGATLGDLCLHPHDHTVDDALALDRAG